MGYYDDYGPPGYADGYVPDDQYDPQAVIGMLAKQGFNWGGGLAGIAKALGGAGGGLTKLLGGPAGLALSTFAPAGISWLLGHRGQSVQQMRARADSFMTPEHLESDARRQFDMTRQSPGYNMARSEMVGAGQTAQAAIGRAMGQTGMGRSGVGLAMKGAAAAAPGIHMGRLTASAWDQAMQHSLQRNQFRAQLAMQGGPQESLSREFLGAGMNAFMPYMFKMLQDRKKHQQSTGYNLRYGHEDEIRDALWRAGRRY